jgi:hypothetical protein
VSLQINFYDPALRLRRAWLTLDMLALMSVTLLVILALAAYALHLRMAGLEAQAATLSAQVTGLRQARDDLDRQRAEQSRALQARLSAGQARLASQSALLAHLHSTAAPGAPGAQANVMRAFARQHREGLWLTGFSLSPPDTLALRGRSLSAKAVPDYVRRLQTEPILAGYRFDSLVLTRPDAPPAPDPKTPTAAPAYLEFSLGGAAAPAARERKP